MKKLIVLALTLVMICCLCTGCFRKPYDAPEFVTIEPHQTAFLIPLVGDTTNQASFESEEMLMQAKVSTKEIEIPHRWVQTGRKYWMGEYRDTMALIIVDRSPVTREWSSTDGVGTSAVNQAIYAESAESIGFSAGMNCSAQIYSEEDAVKFLYCYNNKPLSEIMDSEIRARVESKFVEECASRTLNEILIEKEAIMDAVRTDVETYFAERGVTILPCKMGDEVWGIKSFNNGGKRVKKGVVHQMFYGDDMRLCIAVKGVCRGVWNEKVFATEEDARCALEACL